MTGGAIDGGLVGNPNDYVFSQTALDNIITQLMEQTGGASAPPPAPDHVIESLTKRHLNEKEKSQETDCAVCKDQFGVEEEVIELPCDHIFHDECIKPWLKLNSTCPVCRHSVLSDQQQQESSNETNRQQNSNESTTNPNPQNTSQEQTADNNPNVRTFSFNSGNGNNVSGVVIGSYQHSPSDSQQQQTNPTSSWPLNLSAAFPWINNLTRQQGSNTTTTTTTTAEDEHNTNIESTSTEERAGHNTESSSSSTTTTAEGSSCNDNNQTTTVNKDNNATESSTSHNNINTNSNNTESFHLDDDLDLD
ncbi:uncharacterized protein BX663DRAFT_104694 [Cokeromyces recurvatus]|uniref:uncharacterized protein n=1 Tax=Cokeromyces recurvatus TaxID=90255 RepID=UPI00221EBD29|nr:uncharacterized protein BX663DRAFT_104694 [Cokeromyces recurvatus]KAI7901315.1 hypothetical protein BX663DRAFT_104694 [Cokeromyces recurvatus]